MRGKAPVSVLIPAKNEQREIAACIASVAWADEVIVADSCSQDQTVVMATELGARVVQFEYVPGGPKKKNWALSSIPFRNEWVLILDADERVSSELAAEISQLLSSSPEQEGYFINRRLMFMGRWIKHAGYFPSWNLRLFKHAKGRYEYIPDKDSNSGDNEVHEHVLLDGSAGHLNGLLDHYAYRSIDQFVEKHNRYSNWESTVGRSASQSIADKSEISGQLNVRRHLKRLGRSFPFPHWLRFFYHYVLKQGFRDGRPGYILCHLLGEYEFLIGAKALERAVANSGAQPGQEVEMPPARTGA